MHRKTAYIETSIISYLTARPSRDIVAAAWQKITSDWWKSQRHRFRLVASEIVIEEAGRGDAMAVSRRLGALQGIPLLPITDEVLALAEDLIGAGALPPSAIGDSLHIAISAVHKIDYLVTWNYRHIDNAETKPIIRRVCLVKAYGFPEICTPQELMGVFENGR